MKNVKKILDLKFTSWTILFEKGGIIHDDKKMITLNNGVEIPQVALGTWLIDDNKVEEPVKTAIRLGYRHVDTAQAYALNFYSHQ